MRVAASVVTGVRDDKTLSEIIKYYWLPEEDAQKWWDFFGFDGTSKRERKKRVDKTSSLDKYLESNIGKVVSAKALCEELGISNPTFYNYLNVNRSKFKKAGRGQYMIIDPNDRE